MIQYSPMTLILAAALIVGLHFVIPYNIGKGKGRTTEALILGTVSLFIPILGGIATIVVVAMLPAKKPVALT